MSISSVLKYSGCVFLLVALTWPVQYCQDVGSPKLKLKVSTLIHITESVLILVLHGRSN